MQNLDSERVAGRGVRAYLKGHEPEVAHRFHSSRSFAGPQPGDHVEFAPEVRDRFVAFWIDGDARARVVVDNALVIHWTSAAAHALLDAADHVQPLLCRGRRLIARENRLHKQLKAFVGRATREPSTWCAAMRQPEHYMVVTAMRLQPPWEDLVGLTLYPGADESVLKLGDLHQAFGFTPAELKVAQHLLCGRTAEETAEELGVSLQTVRTHIKRAYGKLGVSSREAFFHKLMPFASSPE